MKKIIFFSIFVFATLASKAYDIKYAGCYKSVKVEFQSIDENNNPITLSELVTYPLDTQGAKREVGFFVLSSMPLAYDDLEMTATGSTPFDATALRTIATEGAMCVQVDYQGFGSSSAHDTIPYMVNNLNARQSIDGLFAAIQYAKDNGITINPNYYTINCGFSLDGGRAIAIQRYLEKYCSKEDRELFRLRKTICGDAPINATETIKFALGKWLNGPQYISFVDGFLKTKSVGTLHGVSREDIINYSDSTIRQKAIDGTSPAGRALWKALSQENLDEGWIPETPITCLHLQKDSMVIYKNAEIGLNAWGADKFKIIDEDMSDRKWNISVFKALQRTLYKYSNIEAHYKAAAKFYAGMIDGCLRDTTITDVYGADMNFYKMMIVLFDVASNLNHNIPVNISTKIANGTLNIKSLGYLHFDGDIVDSLGNVTTKIDVTVRPEAKDSLSTLIRNIDAKGYLHLPIDFKVTLVKKFGGKKDIVVYGTCNDLYQFVEFFTATMLHHKCSTEEEAKKYCDAINSSIVIKVDAAIMKPYIMAWYTETDSCYIIEPYLSLDGEKASATLHSWENILGFDVYDYMTIDNVNFDAFGYKVWFHATEDLYGEQKFYADILTADSTVFARTDFDLTGVDMNEDGTLQTLNIGFTVDISNSIILKGTCKNINDAILATILCYGNLSCETEAQAQGYATAVNDNAEMEVYMISENEDGTTKETDHFPLHAVVAQDENGAYFVQFCINMGLDIPISQFIDLVLPNLK